MTHDREYERHKEVCAMLLRTYPRDCSYATPEWCAMINSKIIANRIQKPSTSELKQKYAAITINPPVSYLTFKELWQHAIAKFPFSHYEMVIEQNTNGGIRPHLHILVPIGQNDRKHQLIDKVFIRMDLPSKECVNLKTITKMKDLQAWRNYLNGLKTPEKGSFVEKDTFDRIKFEIPNLFSNLKI